MDRKTELKIKIESLGLESRRIRQEEVRLRNRARATTKPTEVPELHAVRTKLYLHRMFHVKHECRHSLLAYGFLRRRRYRQLERTVREGNEPNPNHVVQLVKRFGKVGDPELVSVEHRVRQWLAQATIEPATT